MIERPIVIGIDTSNYTTSVALVYADGELIANIKRPLPVKPGEVGLRQSDAVFAHVKNLPSAMDEAKEFLNGRTPSAVGVSTRPRNVEGSYMPCFLAGVAAAKSIASALSVKTYEFSHQCGHIMAALYSSDGWDMNNDVGKFAAFHVSGGTTEMLSVERTEVGFSAEIVGGTKDISAGQLIDRIGVHLGLKFPAGPELERLALDYHGKIPSKKIPQTDGFVNLSGIENIAKRMMTETSDPSLVAAFTLNCVAKALEGMTQYYRNNIGAVPFVYAGGVMCNSLLRDFLKKRFDAYFATPAMSSDNAVGIAVLAAQAFCKDMKF